MIDAETDAKCALDGCDKPPAEGADHCSFGHWLEDYDE